MLRRVKEDGGFEGDASPGGVLELLQAKLALDPQRGAGCSHRCAGKIELSFLKTRKEHLLIFSLELFKPFIIIMKMFPVLN